MSRLIDADKLIEELKSSRYFIAGLRCQKSILGQTMTNYAKLINKTIKEQSTAYNVDKVVEQLSCCEGSCNGRNVYKDCEEGCAGCTECKMEDAYRIAIEIVKAGGIDE